MALRRGFMMAPYVPVEHIREALTWGVNILRYQIAPGKPDEFINFDTRAKYLEFVSSHAAYIGAVIIPELVGKDVILVIDLHKAPSKDVINLIKDAWINLSKTFKNSPITVIYDLLNEPSLDEATLNKAMATWRAAIRKQDKLVRVVISSKRGEPQRFNKVANIADSRLWYTFHMYQPMSFTHQGIGNRPTGVRYPTATITTATLKKNMKAVRDFQLKYKKPILVGEFSASNLANGMDRRQYVADCIEIFEEYRWNYIFHAHREAPIWTPYEWVDVPLKEAFSRNGS